ncbi:MAG TPA: class I SAM-dependent methyltransferase [Thermoleophilaceae bacterium]
MTDAELDRIRTEYERREREVGAEDWRVRLFVRQLRERVLLEELGRAGSLPLAGRRVLDVGCGHGQWLADFETWGARQADLAGIELDPDRAARARERLPAADVQEGNAAELPWPDGSFDVVLQATLLSSLVDPELRRAVAADVARVTAPGGVIASYDMRIGNPRNEHVRGVSRRELAELFPGFEVRARPVTLLLPLSRRVAVRSFRAAGALEGARLLNTHLLAVLKRP